MIMLRKRCYRSALSQNDLELVDDGFLVAGGIGNLRVGIIGGLRHTEESSFDSLGINECSEPSFGSV